MPTPIVGGRLWVLFGAVVCLGCFGLCCLVWWCLGLFFSAGLVRWPPLRRALFSLLETGLTYCLSCLRVRLMEARSRVSVGLGAVLVGLLAGLAGVFCGLPGPFLLASLPRSGVTPFWDRAPLSATVPTCAFFS